MSTMGQARTGAVATASSALIILMGPRKPCWLVKDRMHLRKLAYLAVSADGHLQLRRGSVGAHHQGAAATRAAARRARAIRVPPGTAEPHFKPRHCVESEFLTLYARLTVTHHEI